MATLDFDADTLTVNGTVYQLKPLGEVLLDGKTIDELLLGVESIPTKSDPVPNLVMFPLSARTAGVA